MRKLCILVEGQTEVAFCKRILSSYFGKRYMVIPITITTGKDKRGNIKKGGMVSWSKTNAELRRMAGTYKESNTVFSTMLDLYAISSDVPGYDAAQMKQDPYAKVDVIENSMKEECAAMQGRIFVPLYDKRTDGISLIESSGIDYLSTSVIDYLSTKCKHFGEWIKRLLAI